MFKLNKRNSRKRCEMLKVNNKDTQTTSMNIFKYTSHIALMFLLLTWNMWSIFGFCVYLYNCDFILNIWLLTYFTNEINDAVLVPLLYYYFELILHVFPKSFYYWLWKGKSFLDNTNRPFNRITDKPSLSQT